MTNRPDRHVGLETRASFIANEQLKDISVLAEDIVGRVEEISDVNRFGKIKGDDTFMTVQDLTITAEPEPCVVLTDGVTRSRTKSNGEVKKFQLFIINPVNRGGVVYIEEGKPDVPRPRMQPNTFEYIVHAGTVNSRTGKEEAASAGPGPRYHPVPTEQKLKDVEVIDQWLTEFEELRDAKILKAENEKKARRRRNFYLARSGVVAATVIGAIAGAVTYADDAIEAYQEATAPTPQERADALIQEALDREAEKTRVAEQLADEQRQEELARIQAAQEADREIREEVAQQLREYTINESFPDLEGFVIPEEGMVGLPFTEQFHGDERPPRFDGSDELYREEFYEDVTGPRLFNAPSDFSEGSCNFFDVKYDRSTRKLVGAHTGGGGRVLVAFFVTEPVNGEEAERLAVCDIGEIDLRDGSGSERGDIIIQAQPIGTTE